MNLDAVSDFIGRAWIWLRRIWEHYSRVSLDFLCGDREYWDALSSVGPALTAIIALCAALIALRAIRAQRDIARRRAAIDFFLKTETDGELIQWYETFRASWPDLRKVNSQQLYDDFKTTDQFRKVKSFLHLLELIAVGVNQKAFSNIVSYDYWGDIVLKGWEASESFAKYARQDDAEGFGRFTWCELQKLHRKWKWRDRLQRVRRLGP